MITSNTAALSTSPKQRERIFGVDVFDGAPFMSFVQAHIAKHGDTYLNEHPNSSSDDDGESHTKKVIKKPLKEDPNLKGKMNATEGATKQTASHPSATTTTTTPTTSSIFESLKTMYDDEPVSSNKAVKATKPNTEPNITVNVLINRSPSPVEARMRAFESRQPLVFRNQLPTFGNLYYNINMTVLPPSRLPQYATYITLQKFREHRGHPLDDPSRAIPLQEGLSPISAKVYKDINNLLVIDRYMVCCADKAVGLMFFDGPSRHHRNAVLTTVDIMPMNVLSASIDFSMALGSDEKDLRRFVLTAPGIDEVRRTKLIHSLFPTIVNKPSDAKIAESEEFLDYWATVFAKNLNNIIRTTPTNIPQYTPEGGYAFYAGSSDEIQSIALVEIWARASRLLGKYKGRKAFIAITSHIEWFIAGVTPELLAGNLVGTDGTIPLCEDDMRELLLFKLMCQYTSKERELRSLMVPAVNFMDIDNDPGKQVINL